MWTTPMEACLTGMSTFQVSTKHGVRSRRLQSYAWEVRKYPGSSHEQNGTDADACITWLSEWLLRRPSRMQPRPGMQCATRHVVACGRTRGLQPPQVCTAPTCCGYVAASSSASTAEERTQAQEECEGCCQNHVQSGWRQDPLIGSAG